MTRELLVWLLFLAGIGQLSILVASSLVPFQLNWKKDLASLPRLHWQMYWVYGGYVAMTIVSLGLVGVFHAEELASNAPLARSVCIYGAFFWGVRLLLQGVFDAKPYLKTWWLRSGYYLLTVMFLYFTVVYTIAATGFVK